MGHFKWKEFSYFTLDPFDCFFFLFRKSTFHEQIKGTKNADPKTTQHTTHDEAHHSKNFTNAFFCLRFALFSFTCAPTELSVYFERVDTRMGIKNRGGT